VVKVMSTKKVLVKVHPEGKYGMFAMPLPVAFAERSKTSGGSH
jgi:hypothetical protein